MILRADGIKLVPKGSTGLCTSDGKTYCMLQERIVNALSYLSKEVVRVYLGSTAIFNAAQSCFSIILKGSEQ